MEDEGQAGLYCSTAGAYFESKDELAEHYRSDFHRYNLKRKIAGMPPVTREWYDARRAQLMASSATPVHKVWFDPLTRRKFYSENTYLAFARSKKYGELVKKSGSPAPAPIVTLRKMEQQEGGGGGGGGLAPLAAAGPTAAGSAGVAASGGGFTVKPGVKSAGAAAARRAAAAAAGEDGAEEDEADDGSAWETASEEEMETDQQWEEWDVRRSFFDGHVSPSLEANLEHMWKRFGFYLPDAEFLSDPEGLIKYLGAKLQYGHVPLYESGDNPQAKQFASLHAVQRHMVDTNQCKLAWEGNEEEYADYYEYGSDEEEEPQAGALALSVEEAGPSAAYELVLAGGGGTGGTGGGGKILGSREFARYYRQRHRAGDARESVQAAQVQAQYRRLAVPLLEGGASKELAVQQRKQKKWQNKAERLRFAMDDKYAVINNLPKNVPY